VRIPTNSYYQRQTVYVFTGNFLEVSKEEINYLREK